MNDDRYESAISYVDLTFNMLLFFVCLFTISYLQIAVKKVAEQKVDAKTEFLVTVTWNNESSDDVDTYILDPLGNLVFFQSKEKGLMHLDRDDLGKSNDTITLADGTQKEILENRELVSIRAIIPGEYILNAHMYNKAEAGDTTVNFKLEKINPSVRTVMVKDVVLSQTSDEKTAFRFTLDEKGNVSGISDAAKSLATQVNPNHSEYGPEGPD